jgi:hypothetical protein
LAGVRHVGLAAVVRNDLTVGIPVHKFSNQSRLA